MVDFSSNIHIILVNTSHPGNIGSVARAMKTMGLHQLCLVNPCKFPDGKATAMAVGADDVLQSARVFSSLQEAVANCQLVIGTTARLRRIEWPQLSPDQCARRVVIESTGQQQVGLVFGRESAGLSNEELDLCHFLVNIPSVETFSSLNIAAAVQIICYEVRKQSLGELPEFSSDVEDGPLATGQDFEGFMGHLTQILDQVGFINQKASMSLIRRIRRIFTRIRLNVRDINILRGILSAIEDQIKRK